jgi:exonuclease VII small subunit
MMAGDGATGRRTMADAFRFELSALVARYRDNQADLRELVEQMEHEISYLDVAILKRQRARESA